ncbi:UNVERIFIED_CONTAM: hypothetical protein K2H54_031791 [Gekko kuhli]
MSPSGAGAKAAGSLWLLWQAGLALKGLALHDGRFLLAGRPAAAAAAPRDLQWRGQDPLLDMTVTSAPVAPPSMDKVYIAVELCIAVLSIAGNILVCWAVAINSTLKNATNYFLVSLAVADIAVGLLAIPFAVTISIGFYTNFHCCLFLACFVLVLTQSSIFSLLAVAVDRYLAIKIPLRCLLRVLEKADGRLVFLRCVRPVRG